MNIFKKHKITKGLLVSALSLVLLTGCGSDDEDKGSISSKNEADKGNMTLLSNSGDEFVFLDENSKIYEYSGYDEMSEFYNFTSVVSKDGESYVMNKDEEKIIDGGEYDSIEGVNPKHKLFIVEKNSKFGLVDNNGKELTKIRYDYIGTDFHFDERLILAKRDNLFIYLNDKGKEVYKSDKVSKLPRYDILSEDCKLQRIDVDWGSNFVTVNIDTGKIIIDEPHSLIDDNLISTFDNRLIIVDKNGKKLKELDNVTDASRLTKERIRIAYDDEKSAIINNDGEEIIGAEESCTLYMFKNTKDEVVYVKEYFGKFEIYDKDIKLIKSIEGEISDVHDFTKVVNSSYIATETSDNFKNIVYDFDGNKVIDNISYVTTKINDARISYVTPYDGSPTVLLGNGKKIKVDKNKYLEGTFFNSDNDIFLYMEKSNATDKNSGYVIDLDGKRVVKNIKECIQGNGSYIVCEDLKGNIFTYNLDTGKKGTNIKGNSYDLIKGFNAIEVDGTIYSYDGTMLHKLR